MLFIICTQICFISNNIPFVLKQKKKVRKWIEETAKNENKKIGEITFLFCNDEYILEINKKYLKHDYLTDIITFDYCEDDILSGDIVISVERVKENSKIFKVAQKEEMLRVIIHGILHLCAYKDTTKKEKLQMRQKENYYLKNYH